MLIYSDRYDVSGVPANKIQRILQHDWNHLVRNKGVLDSPNYLKERGKPVIALWGFGFEHAGHTPELVRSIVQFFRQSTPGGVYVMGGAPSCWRLSEGDADRHSDFVNMWLNEFDAISPWTIGRYKDEQEADAFAESKMKGDVELIKKRNEETGKRVDYIPVVLPGGSVSLSLSLKFAVTMLILVSLFRFRRDTIYLKESGISTASNDAVGGFSGGKFRTRRGLVCGRCMVLCGMSES